MNIVSILLEGTLLAQSPALLDLAASPPKPWDPPKVSISFGGSAYDTPRIEPKLPLEIVLESIEPIPERPRQSLVNILVRNIGSKPYSLPVGRDGEAALSPTNHGRHKFYFNLKLANERYGFLTGQLTYASTDLAGSMMTIPPRGTVRVRFRTDVGAAVRTLPRYWLPEGTKELDIQGAVVDTVFDDNPREYHLTSPRPDAFSANSLRVPLVRGDDSPEAPRK